MSNVIEVCKVNSYADISKLKFHPKNPRTIKVDRLEQLKDSIIKKGFYQPILVWKKGGIVLAGNHRLLAAQELVKEGWTFKSPEGKENVLPIVMEDVSDEVAEQILFETNNTYAEWVEDKLRDAIQSAEQKGRSISSFGFTTDYVDNLLASAIDDAEKATKKIRDSMDEEGSDDLDKLMAETADEEEFESLILPKSVYTKLTALLADISEALVPEWHEGDGYKEAVLALLQAADETEITEHIKSRLASEELADAPVIDVETESDSIGEPEENEGEEDMAKTTKAKTKKTATKKNKKTKAKA
jgi:ParB-like chromosome segregation protein Spo0J